jgi:dihydrofolate synthase/folylpolyglutamate synthase
MMSLHPKIIDLTLDRVWRLLAALGHPESALPPVIHIAGTNGKGSTQAMIRAGLEGAGDTRVPRLYLAASRAVPRTHPAGRDADPEPRCRDARRCLAANGGDPITYFEITTCAAPSGLLRTPGRLDAARGRARRAARCHQRDRPPRADVITPVDMDHQQFLGDTLPRSRAKRPGSSSAACPASSARSTTPRSR